MNDKMKAEFDAAFVKKFGFGRMMASANADAHQMLNAAEWAWEAAAPQKPSYDEAKERELFNAWYGELPTTKLKETMWMAWEACAQSRAKAGEDE
ncbi:hypothetical protein HRJ41_21500 [Pseudomonas sp. BF61]|uniref:hypothetical protein n=1 Tax=Pseudomonas sp. BF61 TaxID=2741068 RepID=UPI001C0C484C|nr:hypothetical protein [Pseudomonas sp. BF61]MBU4630050.1 hypothetical protein [Pseudomonas sp. BF61]